MKKVIEYDILTSYNRENLVRRINERISVGWQPVGGIAIESKGAFGQAVVKYEEKKKPSTRTASLVGKVEKASDWERPEEQAEEGGAGFSKIPHGAYDESSWKEM